MANSNKWVNQLRQSTKVNSIKIQKDKKSKEFKPSTSIRRKPQLLEKMKHCSIEQIKIVNFRYEDIIKYIKGKQFVYRTPGSVDHQKYSFHSLLIIFLVLLTFPSLIALHPLHLPHPNLYCCMSFVDLHSTVVAWWNSTVATDTLCCFWGGLIHVLMLSIDHFFIGVWLWLLSLLSSFFRNRLWTLLWFRDSSLTIFLIPWSPWTCGWFHFWEC